jgi:uncharacterized RDD family membrane protein YckC
MTEPSTSGDPITDQVAPPRQFGHPMFGVYGADQLSGEGFGRRALAKVIDAAILNIVEFAAVMVAMIVFTIVGTVMGIPYDTLTRRFQTTTFFSFVVATVAMILYFTLFEWLSGTTPGKRLLGLVVVTEEVERCALGAAVKRNLVLLPETLAWGIPAFLSIRDSARGQRHGDRWAGTIVPRRESVPEDVRGTLPQFMLATFMVLVVTGFLTLLSVGAKAFPALMGG